VSETIVATSHVEDAPAPPPPTRAETVSRLVGLLAGSAAVTLLILATGGWPWLVVVVSIFGIIMLHEAGHFVTAKWSGMKATEFFVGFGPKLWSIRRGETEYGIKAIPAGGYVKILGMTSIEELDPTDEPRSFVNQTTRKRVLVASAGSLVHLGLALALAFVALFFFGKPLVSSQVEITGLSSFKGVVTPAAQAGLHLGDVIVSIDGATTTASNVVTQIHASDGHQIRIVVLRDGKDRTLLATPRAIKGVSTAPILGVFLGQPTVLSHPGLIASLTGTTSLVWSVADQTGHVFATSFSPSGIGSLVHQVTNSKAGAAAKKSGGGSVSIIGASQWIADAARAGVEPLLGILISLNISLGILNMLPMLPLDGGHVAIALYERVRTRRGKARYRADVRKLMPVVYAFLAFLAFFVVSKMYLDIAHGSVNPFG
jgi:membrane-associated protease RseP (regulator of RpoE activity)